MVVQKPQRALSWTTYINTLDPTFWFSALANVLICALALYAITNME